MHLDPTIAKVVVGTIVSGILTVGGLSYSNKAENDTQEVRLARLEKSEAIYTKLTEQLALTNQNMAVLNERINALKEELRREAKSQ